MNTYLVPTTAEYSNKYTYITVIYAESEKEAYQKAITEKGFTTRHIQKYTDNPYEVFFKQISITTKFFSITNKNAILKEAFQKEGMEYMELIKLYDYMFWGDYNAQIQSLADKAIKESWNFENKNDNVILKNYLLNTFYQLQRENKVIETEEYCLFNTGLFTDRYIPIYAYGELNKKYLSDSTMPKWYFKGFKDEYELTSIDVDVDFPERADYFQDTTLLVFDWHCKVHPNYNHILEDLNTYNRLPNCIKQSDRPLEVLKGYIDTAIQKVTANYKLAIPHYYQEKIQLMIPLCFTKDDTPDIALILEKRRGNHYQAKTCLTMEMAYMDARLIAKPESDWLCADHIIEDKTEE